MKGKYFKNNLEDIPKLILEESDENKFLNSVRKVVRLLQVDEEGDAYAPILINNLRGMCAEIAVNIDEFLENMNISFRAEDFLLLLFQELYEQLVYSR